MTPENVNAVWWGLAAKPGDKNNLQNDNMREISSDQIFDSSDQIWSRLRPCKAIYPKKPNVSGGGGYSRESPRLVKSEFKVPSNWAVLKTLSDGQPILDEKGREITQVTAGVRQVLVHVCQKPYNGLSDRAGGFYAQWSPTTREIKNRLYDPQ